MYSLYGVCSELSERRALRKGLFGDGSLDEGCVLKEPSLNVCGCAMRVCHGDRFSGTCSVKSDR